MTARVTDWVLHDGVLRRRAEARLPIDERGYLYGEGLLETLPVRDGVPVDLARHRARLAASAATLGLPEPPTTDTLDAGIAQLLGALGADDGVVRVTWSAGSGGGPVDLPPGPPTLLLGWRPPPVAGRPRLLPVRFRPGELAAHKTLDRWPYLLARRRAIAAGADDALLVDQDDRLLESSLANVALRVGDDVLTPPADGRILPGIGRARMLEAGAHARVLTLREAHAADAVLLVSAVRGRVEIAALADGVLERTDR